MQYVIAWTVYLVAGTACCFIWWKITSYINRYDWRALLRSLAVVLIITPWYSLDSPGYFAPAFMVLFMDLLQEGDQGGLKSGIVLLLMIFVVLVALSIRVFWLRRKDSSG